MIKSGLQKYFDNRGKLKNGILEKVEEYDGYSCIFSTRLLDKKELVHNYFGKDLVEKAFHALKSVIKLQPIRHWLAHRVIAHVFICYLSYLLLSLLKYRLKELDITPEAALDELKSMYKVYLRDSKNEFKMSRVVTLTKRQELIIKIIDKKLLELKC
jgi:transposase